jgi:hypothetical protein
VRLYANLEHYIRKPLERKLPERSDNGQRLLVTAKAVAIARAVAGFRVSGYIDNRRFLPYSIQRSFGHELSNSTLAGAKAMAKFLNTSATNYYLEDIIKQTRERLVIISPFLKFNDRIKELLEDTNRMKIDVRIVYGKSELAPREINWLRPLEFVRASYCQNLHAKCYLNERSAILTSMNLYDFSQVNNNEMGVFIERDKEPELYREIMEEAQRLIRISEQIRLSAEIIKETSEKKPAGPPPPRPTQVAAPAQSKVNPPLPAKSAPAKSAGAPAPSATARTAYEKISASQLAKERNVRKTIIENQLIAKGLLAKDGDKLILTPAGKQAGGEPRSSKFGPFFVWPKDIQIS